MKKNIFSIMFILMVFCLSAQELNLWHNFRYSGKTPSDLYHIQWQGLSTPFTELNMIYKLNGELQTVQIENPDVLDYRATIPAPDYDAPSIALSTQTDYFGILTPFKIASNSFTRSVMVEASADSLYEVQNNGDNNLDLASFSFAYSNSKLAAGLVNVAGSYPNYGTILGPYYAYGVGLINPENIADSTAYALINANIMGLITPGLYKLNASGIEDLQDLDLSNIENLGSINVNTTNNMLIMECDWNLLTNDPNFGDWPSYSKSLITIPFIAKIPSLSDLTPVADIGMPTVINFTDLSINMADNTPPQLYSPELISYENSIEVKINYFDFQFQYPLVAKFVVDDNEYEMMPDSFNFHDAVCFSTNIPYTDWISGECVFSDDSLHVVTQQIDNNVGTNDIVQIDNSFNIYPNPLRSGNMIKIKNNNNKQLIRVSIYNIKGQKVRDEKIQSNNKISSISTADDDGKPLASGLYFIRGDFGNMVKTKKIMIIN
ncbi:MAG: T9SS type A sorting domain-containing protein [Candidatus Cloacimonadales bacterium]|jgi:hypothetical protein|nr:T9SS type A sorting domain-containing protein [Candidatus Cloacimonadota bacterium]MDX9977716.1 T9SS type A sorting domain-containing protein [Candidatus Cloacimonadales bacterium]